MIFYVLRPENVLKFTKNFVLKCHYVLLGPLIIVTALTMAMELSDAVESISTSCSTSTPSMFEVISPVNALYELRLPSWRSGLVGNVIGRINEVNQRRAWLVLGWVTTDHLQNG